MLGFQLLRYRSRGQAVLQFLITPKSKIQLSLDRLATRIKEEKNKTQESPGSRVHKCISYEALRERDVPKSSLSLDMSIWVGWSVSWPWWFLLGLKKLNNDCHESDLGTYGIGGEFGAEWLRCSGSEMESLRCVSTLTEALRCLWRSRSGIMWSPSVLWETFNFQAITWVCSVIRIDDSIKWFTNWYKISGM